MSQLGGNDNEMARPSQVTIVTIDGTDRDDCEVTAPESDPTLDCAEAPKPTPAG